MNNSLSAGRKRLRRGTGILLKEMRHNNALFCLQHQGNDGWVSDCRGLGNSDRIRCKFSIGWRFNCMYVRQSNHVKVLCVGHVGHVTGSVTTIAENQ